MHSGFIEKLVSRLDRLEPRQVQSLVDRLVRDKGFLENVFEALREGVLILDPDGAVSFVNAAACGFFGLDAEEAIGRRLNALVRGLDWHSLMRPGRQAVSRDLEVFYPENRYLNFYLAPIAEDLDGEEAQLGYVMLVRDITESRREAEATLESDLGCSDNDAREFAQLSGPLGERRFVRYRVGHEDGVGIGGGREQYAAVVYAGIQIAVEVGRIL